MFINACLIQRGILYWLQYALYKVGLLTPKPTRSLKIGKKRAIIKWMQIGAFLQGSDCHATVNMCLLLAQRQYTKRFWQTSKINTAGFQAQYQTKLSFGEKGTKMMIFQLKKCHTGNFYQQKKWAFRPGHRFFKPICGFFLQKIYILFYQGGQQSILVT